MELLIQPDEGTDSLYICFTKDGLARGAVVRSVRATEDVTLDFGDDDRLIGLDVMNASSVVSPDFSKIRLDSLLGVKEAAELIGVQKPNFVRDYANNPEFPQPVAELATGRVWLRSQVEAFKGQKAPNARSRRLRAAS
jgi:uncharacterized protein YuzE/predicted DNA-binding transcriptional regulator AlpA